MKRFKTLILLLSICGAAFGADSTAVITRIASNEAADVRRLDADVYENTSLMGYRYANRLTDVSINYSYSTQSQAVIPQMGSGYMGGDVKVSSYQRLLRGAVWGGASYTRGKIYNMQVNETSDYMMLFPYVMADSVGGDLPTQSYKINGGFNVNLPKGFDIAAEASYRATIEARQKDPRPKNIVSDLKAQVAASYAINDSMHLALGVEAAKYKQTNVIKFYSEMGVPNVVHLTGLGTRYYRFDGSNYATYYNGYSVGGNVGLLTIGSGWSASAHYLFRDYDKIMSSLNELPLVNMKEHTARGYVSYGVKSGELYWSVGLQGSYIWRAGTENIFGDPADNIYPQIASITQYHLSRVNAGISAKCGFIWSFNELALTPHIGYNYHKESYFYPALSLMMCHLKFAIDLDYMLTMPKWSVTAKLHGSYNPGLKADATLGDTTVWNAPLYQTFNSLSNYYGSAGLKIKAAYSWRPDVALYLSAGYSAGFCTSSFSHTAEAAFGVLF